jgi:hypothetical protein
MMVALVPRSAHHVVRQALEHKSDLHEGRADLPAKADRPSWSRTSDRRGGGNDSHRGDLKYMSKRALIPKLAGPCTFLEELTR